MKLSSLLKLASELDSKGLFKYADEMDQVVVNDLQDDLNDDRPFITRCAACRKLQDPNTGEWLTERPPDTSETYNVDYSDGFCPPCHKVWVDQMEADMAAMGI
jgi:hypothetical protein